MYQLNLFLRDLSLARYLLLCILLLLRILLKLTVLEEWYMPMTRKYMWFSKNDSDCTSIITKLERCINDIKAWSSANDLKLNEDKTEVIHITSRFRKPSHLPFVNIADVPVQPVKSARNLGVIFENDLRMDTYIQNICRSASYAMYKIGRIRNYLDEKSTETLIHAFITCRIDQCNSLLYGLPDSHIANSRGYKTLLPGL